MSLRTRLLLLILFATLLPAVVGGVIFLQHRDAAIAEARAALLADTRQIAQDLANTVRSTAQLHFGLSRARDFDTQDAAACSAFLAEVLKAHPQYTGILTITPQGDLFCDSLRTGRRLVLTDRQYFKDAMGAGGPLAVEPVFGRLTGIAVLQIAYAARDDAGRPRFVLLASLNLERYMGARARTLARANSVVALMDAKGTVLTWHPDGARVKGVSMAGTALHHFARERPGENVRDGLEADGMARIWTTSTLPGFPDAGLHILLGVSTQDLLADADAQLRQALANLAVVWLIAFALALALAELGIRRPSARIIDAVTRFSGGDPGARIGKPYPGGEIGALMVALDRAFGLIQAQRREIEQLNAGLERRVGERTAQLEASIRELEGFTYTVSHDLRAPLRAIGGFARILVEDYGDRLDAEGRRLIGVVHDNSRKMGELIDDLLEFSRLGRNPLASGPVDIRRLAEQVLAALREGGERVEGVTLGDLPPAVGDAALLRQVWMNLLGNAIKFSGKRPHPVIEVSGRVSDEETVYTVRDNGAGFDMQYYGQLFGVFRRLHGTHEFPGTGVGLAIVHRIVARHGGRVWAEGVVDKGATFHFALPRRAAGGAA